jgi:hypothetical protein
MKNDKPIRRGELPANQQPSGWQFPPRPGYDVDGDPVPLKEVGDMTFDIYPGALDGNVMGVDTSPSATNRLGNPDGSTQSDAHEGSKFQHPAQAERHMAGSTRDPELASVKLSGCDSDGMMDRFPESVRNGHDNLPSDQD